MPKKLVWTEAQDTQIRRLRRKVRPGTRSLPPWLQPLDGHRARSPHRRPTPPREFVPPPEDPARDPLPAGHPRSWGVITAGTVLEDTPYPLPVFPR